MWICQAIHKFPLQSPFVRHYSNNRQMYSKLKLQSETSISFCPMKTLMSISLVVASIFRIQHWINELTMDHAFHCNKFHCNVQKRNVNSNATQLDISCLFQNIMERTKILITDFEKIENLLWWYDALNPDQCIVKRAERRSTVQALDSFHHYSWNCDTLMPIVVIYVPYV